MFWRIGHRLRGLWLGEEMPILQKPSGVLSKLIPEGNGFFCLSVSPDRQKAISVLSVTPW
jgi:hypothetical protein